MLTEWLPPRARDAHKGLFGRVLVLGGDYGMPGAVRIAAEGAARVGAGLVTVVTRPEHIGSVVTARPEVLCYGLTLPSPRQLDTLIRNASIIVVGPGLGQSAWSNQLFESVLGASRAVLVDADGLNLLSKSPPISRQNWILTPHPGEAARLLGMSVAQIQADRPRAIRLLQERYGGVIVLKGAGSLIAGPMQPIQRCDAGNPGMASAGMGDLLSGMIGGLVAQGLTLWEAAQLGTRLHAVAGDRAAAKRGERGLLATDLLAELPFLVNA